MPKNRVWGLSVHITVRRVALAMMLAGSIPGPIAHAAPLAAPSNDNFAAATVITVPGRVSMSSVGSSTEPGEPLPCGVMGSTVWFKFTAPATARLNLNTLSLAPARIASTCVVRSTSWS